MTDPNRHVSGPHVRPQVAVIGGGLAGLAAALQCADGGARVCLFERRNRLGGLTWSFQHAGRWVDNGQHVFLRCCDDYLSFLERIGAGSDIVLPDRLDIPVVAPARQPGEVPQIERLRRSNLPAPFHLAGALLRYRHLSARARLALGPAVLALRRLDLNDPTLDEETFGDWLTRHGQSNEAVVGLWDLITVPTVNLPASEASLAMAAKVFQTGLLSDFRAADVGWSRVPLGRLHGERASAALRRAGVDVHLGTQVLAVSPDYREGADPGFTVRTPDGVLSADGVIVAVPHDVVGQVLPAGALAQQERLNELGSSAIVDVHLVFDRQVTPWPLLAGVRSPVQWVFDRTASSGLESGRGEQYVAVSLSAADGLMGRHPDELVPWIVAELTRLLPQVAEARVVDSIVTKERNATFRARPGTARLRPGPRTEVPGLAIAGAWTDTGWPATMEGAVRSGRAAARLCLSECATGTEDPASSRFSWPAGAGMHQPLTATHTEEVA
jgi:squalene-associated FAD-dependent desaturase